jgi:hypothetical protein
MRPVTLKSCCSLASLFRIAIQFQFQFQNQKDRFMIQLTRKHIRTLRTTIRQSLGISNARRAPTITFRAQPNELLIQAATDKVAIECRLPGNYQPECFAIPYEALSAVEGKQDDLVSLTRRDDIVVLQWADAGIPQSLQFPASDAMEMPPIPDNFITIDRQFLSAMAEAVATTDQESTRFALNCIRLRGSDGQIAATDSAQALIQTGFTFPWDDEILVTGSGAFASSDFAEAGELRIGRSTDWVTLQANSRTLHLRIEKERRFPNIDLQIPTNGSAATTLSLSEDDIDFLLTSAKRLPGASEPNSPVTVELNGVVAIRAVAEDQSNPTELVLSNSRRIGDELRFNTDRKFLTRAAELGFRDIQLRSNEAPAYCQDGRRAYVWALLDESGILHSNGNTTRISSPVTSISKTTQTRTTTSMTTVQPTTTRPAAAQPTVRPAATAATEPEPTPGLLAQAEILRDSLSQALSDTRDLIIAIKRNQKQNRLVETTLRSLKQLEHIGA